MTHRRFALIGKTTIVISLVLAAWAGCARDGQDEPQGDGGTTDPCAGKACGAACDACDPGEPGCSVLGYCGADGICRVPFPVCPPVERCNEDTDCPQESCISCPDGTSACPETRCIGGECITQFPECPTQCETPEDCPQLGMPCQECPDGGIVCPGFDCIDGQCVAKYAGCDYEPCADKTCGAACTVCDPADPNCVETGILKFCDAQGVCRTTYPECPPPLSCSSDDDCPGVGACPRCPGDQCAELQCIDGACRFTCPPAPPAECEAITDCPALGMPCQLCPDGWAACPSVDCVEGQCVASFPSCDGHDPCAGRLCGDDCNLCGDLCQPLVAMSCDRSGACVVAPVECGDPATCGLPEDSGPCDAAIPRFWFDDATGMCEPFVYGGCGGNANNFETARECVETCAQGGTSACNVVACDPGTSCVYLGPDPVCAPDCGPSDECPPGSECKCGGSCPGCEDCRRVCVPSP